MISMPASARVPRGLSAVEKAVGVLLVGMLFFALELLAGSSTAFSALVGLYVVLTAGTIAVAGGLFTFPGVLVLIYAIQHVIASQLLKFAYGERPDERLTIPVWTMLAENLALFGLMVGLLCVSWVKPRKGPLFPPVTDLRRLRQIAFVGVFLALARQAVVLLSGSHVREAAGTAVGPLKQLSMIDAVAFSAVIAVAVLESKGKKITSPFVWIAVAPQLAMGLLMGERAATLTPLMAMAFTAWSFGFRFRAKHFAIVSAFAYVFFFVISPYGLAVRNKARGLDFMTNVEVSLGILGDVIAHPGKYRELNREVKKTILPEKYATLYFNREPDGTSNLLERFSLVKIDDLLINDTMKNGTTEWTTISPAFPNLLPSVFGLTKNFRSGGNMLAHRVKGIVHENDYTTGITTGVVSDSFSSFGWLGVFLIPAILMAMMSFAYRWVIAFNLRRNIFGLAVTLALMVTFSEQSIGGIIPLPIYTLTLTVIAFTIVTRLARLADFRYLRPPTARNIWQGPAPE